MAYLLDANVFIQAKNLHYGFDFCPAFWDWLIASNEAKRVFSIEKVGDEIRAGDDELSEWVKTNGAGLFLAPDEALLPALGKVSRWAASQDYEPVAVVTPFEMLRLERARFVLGGEIKGPAGSTGRRRSPGTASAGRRGPGRAG